MRHGSARVLLVMLLTVCTQRCAAIDEQIKASQVWHLACCMLHDAPPSVTHHELTTFPALQPCLRDTVASEAQAHAACAQSVGTRDPSAARLLLVSRMEYSYSSCGSSTEDTRVLHAQNADQRASDAADEYPSVLPRAGNVEIQASS